MRRLHSSCGGLRCRKCRNLTANRGGVCTRCLDGTPVTLRQLLYVKPELSAGALVLTVCRDPRRAIPGFRAEGGALC